MLIELILYPFWLLVDLIISLFPTQVTSGLETLGSFTFLKIGIYFLPTGWWISFIGSAVFWLTTFITWSITEWVYKKIPGIS